MKGPEIPVTQAVRALRAAGLAFTPHFYKWVEHGGTGAASRALQVDEHAVIKTLVMEARDSGPRPQPLLVLMHGDCEVSTKGLARFLGVKTVAPASEAGVEKHTGYQPGGVSPFGTRVVMPVYLEETLLRCDKVWVNGGRRGFLVAVEPGGLQQALAAVLVQVGLPSAPE
ncbi:MAG: Cys-tRNA(Pro) deacylase [Candidatus Latescibacteria bacterium]|nr:Cys-tRNA(Pro) deacylase [Candidatus Latescibacterota bacterium]